MRTTEVQLREDLENQDEDDDGSFKNQEMVEQEALEEKEKGCKRATPEDPKSMEDNFTLAQLSSHPPTPSPASLSLSSQGRRRKPKEMQYDLSYIFKKRKKQPSASKSKNVVPDLAGKRLRREKTAINGLNSPAQVKSPTMIQAEEFQSSLGPESPSFVKLLVRSHVGSCFWMGLPVPFCKSHLPKNDTMFMLEDESGEQFEIKYIAEKPGLSKGWKKFAVGHKLLEGDVLVFHLVEPNKFKVYIIRSNDLTDVDGALSLLNLDAQAKENDSDNAERTNVSSKAGKRKRTKSLPLTVVQKKNKRTGLPRSVPQLERPVEQSGNESEEVGSEVLEGSKSSRPAIQCKDIKSFENFHIVVNGVCIDSELPEHIRMKYYDLCCSKNAFLHDCLLPSLYDKLVAGIIGQTVNIANAIRTCKLTTSRDEFTNWEKSLKSLELLGMNVGFLRARLRRLVSLAFESEGALDTKRYLDAKTERNRTEDEIRNLQAKLVELKEASDNCDAHIGALKSKAESYELKFQEEIHAPW